MDEYIKVKGARVNNLKNVSYKIPLNKLTCIMGLSGSGKTSLAFHTLYNESKRRFLNSFPTYLKFFSDRPAAVDVDEIKPVLPVFGLPQINPVVGARSNVSDIMHLTELFQNHFYHYSEELCPLHKIEFKPYYLSNYLQTIVSADGAEVYHVLIKADDFLNSLAGQVLPTRSMKSSRARKILEFDKSHELWEVARFKQKHLSSIDEKLNDVISQNLQIYLYSIRLNKVIPVHYKKNQFYCEVAGCDEQKVPSRSALNFSPYNAIGACDECGGFGEVLSYDIAKLVDQEKSICEDGVLFLNYKRFLSQKDELIKVLKKKKISLTDPIKKLPKAFWKILYEGEDKYTGFDSYFRYLERKKYKMHVRIFIRNIQKGEACTSCAGTRLSYAANQFFIDTSGDISLAWAMGQSVQSLYTVLGDPSINLKRATNESKKSLKKILEILKAAIAIGLGHLHVLRKAKSLSAGEYQRLLLIKYLSYEGTGALFIFDEPSLGLGQKELKGILASFKKLIENKNSVILIEHNINLIKAADYLIEVGPQAGALGGEIVFEGECSGYKFKEGENILAPLKIKSPKKIIMKGIEIYNKKLPDISVLQAGITWVTGGSGTGKTSTMINTLAAQLYYLKEKKHLNLPRGRFETLSGKIDFDDVLIIDANLNRYTSRSTVGSMTDLFPSVRKHFLKVPQAIAMGIKEGHLSYNSRLGQCPKCEGRGSIIVEMQFLEDIILECEDCLGKKLKTLYADISDGELSVHEAYSMPLNKIINKIKLTPKYQRTYEYLKILNLDYLSLDRQINSLSGGEKQRIYLLSKLQKSISNSIIFFENISFGLSQVELIRLSEFLQSLSLNNNSIVIIDQDPNFSHIANYTLNLDNKTQV